MLRTRPRLLIADDDYGVRRIVRRAVEDEFDIEVVEATDGFVALERLAAEPVDVLVLDLEMPVMGGFETLEAIRHSPEHAELPVVMLTGLNTETHVESALRLHVVDFLVKPISVERFRERLRSILNQLDRRSGECGGASPVLDLAPRDRVLLVDESDEFREFFRSQLEVLCQVDETASTLAAMRMCLTSPPDAMFLGKASNALLSDALFAKKWAERSELREVPLFRLIEPGSDPLVATFASERTVSARTSDVSTFAERLKPILSAGNVARLLLGPTSPCVGAMFARAHRLMAGVLGEGIRVQPFAALVPPQAPRWVDVTSSLRVHCGCAEVKFQCPYELGLLFASRHLGFAQDQVSDTQASAAIGDAVSSLAGALSEALQTSGVECSLEDTQVRLLGMRYADLTLRGSREIGQWFSLEDTDLRALLRLLPRETSARKNPSLKAFNVPLDDPDSPSHH